MPENILFSTIIPVRITDLNYGGHVGNDRILGLTHEARMQFLHSHGYTEMNAAGCGLIMRDAVLDFRKELFYGDAINIEMPTSFIKPADIRFIMLPVPAPITFLMAISLFRCSAA